jgi:CheY-like chemotaxis protein
MNDHPPCVVLADDDDDDICIFRECFGEVCSDMELLIVQDGQKLMLLLDSGIIPKVIFLDLNMPKMNGKTKSFGNS